MHRSLSILTILIAVGCHSFHNEPPTLQSPTVGAGGPTFIAPGSGSNLLFQSPQGMQQIAANDPNASRSIVIPVTNEDYTWELIVDTVDDYFDVDQEHRVQLVGNVVTEGRIETFPQIGGTLLEPHRRDSVGRYNLVESTFQSVRRRAEIRVMPQQGGWLVEAIVYKEFEDLARPENATAGAASFRFDSSIPSRIDESVSRTKLSKYWIPMGRDCEIETLMLLDLQERIANPPQPHH